MGGLVLLLALVDRVAQAVGRPPGKVFNGVLSVTIFLTMLLCMVYALGWKDFALFAGATLLVPTLLEWIGTRYGRIFGRYHYTEAAGPQAVPGVPWLIVIMWPVMIYPSWLAAVAVMRIVGWEHEVMAVALTPLFATLIDLVLDPVAVQDGLWQWRKKGKWFGVPRTNFDGWFVTVLVTTYIFINLGVPVAPQADGLDTLVFLPVLFAALMMANFIPAARNRGFGKLVWVALGEALLFAGLYGAVVLGA
jgi:putative membrane protein